MKKRFTAVLCLLLILCLYGFSCEAISGKVTLECPNHRDTCYCPKCGWTGSWNEKVTCSKCYGRGKTVCTTCGGTGKSTCFLCKGTGKYKSYKCGGCNGTGKLDYCTNFQCTGGYIECYTCDGTGSCLSERTLCPSCSANVVCNFCMGYDSKEIASPFADLEAYSTVFAYRNVMRSPDGKIGGCFTIQGKISSITNIADNLYSIQLSVPEDDTSYTYTVTWFAQKGSTKLLKGDNVIVYGVFSSYDNRDNPSFISARVELDD